jgi:hypothetical protein
MRAAGTESECPLVSSYSDVPIWEPQRYQQYRQGRAERRRSTAGRVAVIDATEDQRVTEAAVKAPKKKAMLRLG